MISEVLTMIPGPTPVHPRILARLAEPTVSHQFPAFVEDYKETLSMFRKIMGSSKAHPFIFAGGGTLAMEMALVNVIGPDEKLLIINHGFFADRFKQVAEAFRIDYDMISADWGNAVSLANLEDHLANNKYAAVTITHVDTSTGTCSPVAAYADIFRDRDELVILDGVCASAGEDEQFDNWGIDILLTAPQKAFGTPPGLAMLLFSDKAIAKRESLGQIPAYYADIKRWQPIMENPGGYYSTPAVNEIRALHEGCKIILEEGLDKRFKRHLSIAKAIRAGFGAIGMDVFTDKTNRASTLSLFLYPDGVEDADFRSSMAANGVVIAGCLGKLAGKACRVGHMANIGTEEVARTLEAAELAIIACGHDVKRGSALAAAAPHLEW